VFVESNSSQLAGIFTRIESGLTSGYVVHYRSSAPLGRHIGVSVTVDGIPRPATLTYDSPPPPPSTPVVKSKTPKPKSFWVSTLALVIVACAAALLIAFGLFAFLVPQLRRSRIHRRVSEFTGAHDLESAEPREARPSTSLAAVERLLERAAWWEQFKTEVEIARFKRTPVELVTLTALGTATFALLFGLVVAVWLSLLPLLLAPFALSSLVKHRLRKQRELFSDQLPAHLQELASAMRAGHSLVSGIGSMAADAQEPSRSEWAQVVADERLGVPLDEAMRPLISRMASDDVGQVALVAALHQRTGGNMAEVLERVADSARERGELRRELHALTAQARLSRYVVTALPPVVTLAVALLNPGYIRPLFHTTAGVILLFIASGLLVGASLVMRAITNVKV
jgi:tight adherence protein B